MSSPVIGLGTMPISERARQLVMEVLESGRLSYGPMTQKLEADFARLHGCRFGVMSNSGTSALQIALQAMKELHGWSDGDEVIVPAVTFVATVNVVLHNRMTPVLVDVDPHHYDIAADRIEAAITGRTRAIIPVHLFGQPADMDPIRDVAGRRGLKIIEDSAETMFAKYRGRPVGSLGDIACFSTYIAHLLVTGIGGINTTNDPEYAVRLRSLMNHGRDSIYIGIDDDDGKTAQELRVIVARRFQFTSVGHSYRVTEMEAALGLAQLEDFESIVGARRANARLLTEKLRHLEGWLQLPATRPESDHSFMMFPIVLRDEPKVELVNFLEQHGVETRDMLPLTNQPVYRRLGWCESDFPVAQWINQNGFYVGCHQALGEADMDYVSGLIDRYFRRQTSEVRDGGCLVLSTQNSHSVLPQILDDMPRELFDRIIAVDRASSDGTVELLRARDIEVVPWSEDVLQMAANGALQIRQPYVVFMDADGRTKAQDLGRVVLTFERGHDMVIGSRFQPGGARHDRDRRFRYRSTGNRVLTLAANLLFYGNITDALHPFRAIRMERLTSTRLKEGSYSGFYQLSIRAMKEEWKIAEVPTTELVTERDDVVKIALSIPPILRVLIAEWWRESKSSGKVEQP